MESAITTSCDAVVIGGGPAGATAALLLAGAGWSVTVIERKAFPRRKVCGEYLSATNLALFAALGLRESFLEMAGPPVREVGLFAGEAMLRAPLPRLRSGFGHALGRQHLDTMLLDRARGAGAYVWQPFVARQLSAEADGFLCEGESYPGGQTQLIRSRVVLAAHGSWDFGSLPTQGARPAPVDGELFGFKAHFSDSDLAEGLMPLLVFPGGYGGMVHEEAGRVSLSCCVRRDRLRQLRARHTKEAGEIVLDHIRENCIGVDRALDRAKLIDPWLAAGPIRPGIRLGHDIPGLFRIGNAAGEAHPIVAEGISMAMQGAWLLARRLIAWKRAGSSRSELPRLGKDYGSEWRRHFAPRLFAAGVLAQWALRPRAVNPTIPLLRSFPHLLNWGSRLTGKATNVVS